MTPLPTSPAERRRTLSILARTARAATLPVALGAVLIVAGCGEDSSAPATPAPAPAPAPTPTPAPTSTPTATPAPAPTPAPTPSPTPAPTPAPEPATASYTFAQPEVRISPRVPGTLPEGVHFAPPIALVAHARDEAPFAVGEIASDGLKVLAEAGASGAFLAEAEAAGMDVIASSFAALLRVFLSPDPSIELNIERPCLTYAQMIAPTADWIIGFSNVCATDEDGNWITDWRAELLAYDAGTAEGETFAFKTGDTEPRQPIALLDVPPFFVAPAVVQVLTATRKTE